MPKFAELKNFGIWAETCGETYLIGNRVVIEQPLIYRMHEFFKT
jgi:hypothetical protein